MLDPVQPLEYETGLLHCEKALKRYGYTLTRTQEVDITTTHAHLMSAALLSRRANPKRKKCLRYFAKGKSFNLIASKLSFTNSKCVKTIQISKKNMT